MFTGAEKGPWLFCRNNADVGFTKTRYQYFFASCSAIQKCRVPPQRTKRNDLHVCHYVRQMGLRQGGSIANLPVESTTAGDSILQMEYAIPSPGSVTLTCSGAVAPMGRIGCHTSANTNKLPFPLG